MEAVADHHVAAFQRGADDFAHVLSAARGEKKQLRLRHESVSLRGVLQQIPHAVAGGGAARFAGGQAGMSGFAQPRGESPYLRGFAAALGSFESDK